MRPVPIQRLVKTTIAKPGVWFPRAALQEGSAA